MQEITSEDANFPFTEDPNPPEGFRRFLASSPNSDYSVIAKEGTNTKVIQMILNLCPSFNQDKPPGDINLLSTKKSEFIVTESGRVLESRNEQFDSSSVYYTTQDGVSHTELGTVYYTTEEGVIHTRLNEDIELKRPPR